MAVVLSNPFSVTVVPELPAWMPQWESPGVIAAIPSTGSIDGGGAWSDSSLQSAVDARVGSPEDWTPPPDPVPGGSAWPGHLWAWSGGCVCYVGGQPYLLISGGGHANGPDNSIYAFGPLHGVGSETPGWSRLRQPTAEADILTCTPRNADDRPTPRHTAGDFSFGNGKICMLWVNSAHCGAGGAQHGVDVYDVAAGDWDNARGIPHDDAGTFRRIRVHGNSVFVPTKGLFYSVTGGAGWSLGAYNPFDDVVDGLAPRSWREGPTHDGDGVGGDSMCCIMGDEDSGLADVVFTFDRGPGTSTSPQKLDLNTGVFTPWATGDYPSGNAQAIAYDKNQERLYACNSGRHQGGGNQNLAEGTRDVAWVSVLDDDPNWTHETFHGTTPVVQTGTGVFGRWSYVRELRSFVIINSADSEVYVYRTAP